MAKKKKIVWEADVECTACGGTGLYKGMAERGNAAVICLRCKGTGSQHIKQEYVPFTERKKDPNVTRVYKTAGGCGITDVDVTTDEGVTIRFSKAGMTYEEWLNGNTKFVPIYELHCPLQHFDQGTEIGEWLKNGEDDGAYKGRCSVLGLGGYISNCSKKNRKECWKWFKTTKYKDSI